MTAHSSRRAFALCVVLLAALGGACDGKSPGPAKAEPLQLDNKAKVAATTIAQQFVAAISMKRWSSAVNFFDPTMRSQMPSGTLATTWKKVLQESGDFQKMDGTRFEVKDAYRIVYVKCIWAAATGEIKVVVNRDNKIAGLFFLQTTAKEGALKGGQLPPVAPDTNLPQGTVGRVLTTGAEGWPLPAAIIMPEGKGPFPGVVLVHGSGPHDRDETIGPNKPFRELAHALAQRGIAVLRYAKRTKVHGSTLAAKLNFTVNDETVADAAAAAETLRSQPEVNPDKVFYVGHSLGGYLLPRIAKQDPKAAGFIGMAALSRTLWDSLEDQLKYVRTLPGQAPGQAQLEKLHADIATIRALDATNYDQTKLLLDVPSAYWLDLKSYQPTTMAKGVNKPWLFLQGGRDYQVTEADFQAWKKALKGNKQAMFRFYPNLNHLMQPGKAMAVPAEYMKPNTIFPSVFDDIASFIKRHSR